MDFDLTEDNMHLVVVDSYKDFGWGLMTLEGMARQYSLANPNVEVLGGINGDFYNINTTGSPLSVHVSNYEVIRGIQTTYNMLNIREDGSVDIGFANLDGFEIIVKDINDEIKFRERILVNETISTENDIGAFFVSHQDEIPENLDYVVVDAKDIKYEDNGFNFAKGKPNFDLTANDITKERFVIVN